MTDLQRILDKINFVRSQGYISQSEAQELRDRARKFANNKGNISNEEKRKINKQLDDALNKKGKEDKKDGGFNIPKPDKKDDKRPDDKKPVKDDKKPDDKKPGDKKPGDAQTDLQKFINRVNSSDKLSANNKTRLKKEARERANSKGDFGPADRKYLNDLFNKLIKKGPPGPGPGPGPGPKPPEDTDGDGIPDDQDFDDDNDGIPDDEDTDDDEDGIPDDEEVSGPDGPPGDPTVKGGGKKIDIPKAANRADYAISKNAERLGMPNLDKKITREIERLNLQIINIAKEFIEGGIDFYGIDYIAENEIIGEDGRPYYPLPDYNAPPESESGLAEERAETVKALIDELISKGDKSSPNYNYAEFLDLFELRYNGSGTPFFRFSIELTGDLIDDLTLYLVEDDDNKT